MSQQRKRLVVGVSGASGAPLAVALLRALKQTPLESHLIITHGAELTLAQECGMTAEELGALADAVYDNRNIGDGPASGTFAAEGMVVVPCSMKTVAGIHSGYSDTLLLRAADVTLKERRKLVLVPRECPLSTLHLRNLYELSQMGAVILPPVLSYYQHPRSLDDMNAHIVGKILSQFGAEPEGAYHWEGLQP
ncbi:MAG: UbiX family flavin prenyltransferase [Clostridiales bacterium]|nr:UbiX family flavin prenyltransferase [Clostridiales bacterium]